MKLNGWLTELKPEQQKWVIARLFCKSDAAAARQVGITPQQVCVWKKKVPLDNIVSSLLTDPHEAAMSIIEQAVPKAAREKVKGLDSTKEQIRQAASTEILDRIVGKAPLEIKAEVGIRLEVLLAILPAELSTKVRDHLAQRVIEEYKSGSEEI